MPSALRRLLLAGIAANYIHPFSIRPGDKVVILCRVSSQQQGRRGNLNAQAVKLREEVESRDGVVIDVIDHEWSGRGPEWLSKLTQAVRVADQHGAIVLAAVTNRLIRNRKFDSKSPRFCMAQAQEHDLRRLKEATLGVPLMTFLDPDAPEEECRSLLIRWGQEVRGKKGGRPISRNRRLRRWRLRFIQLHESGLKPRDIARQVSEEAGFRVNDMTVRKWKRWWEE
jgi:hypothetical protein